MTRSRSPSLAWQVRTLLGGLLSMVHALLAMTTAELRSNVAGLRGHLLGLAAAITLLMVGLTLLMVALVLALAQFIGTLAATGVVAAVSMLAGLALARHSLSRLSATGLAPRRSMAALQAQITRFAGKPEEKDGAGHEPERHD